MDPNDCQEVRWVLLSAALSKSIHRIHRIVSKFEIQLWKFQIETLLFKGLTWWLVSKVWNQLQKPIYNRFIIDSSSTHRERSFENHILPKWFWASSFAIFSMKSFHLIFTGIFWRDSLHHFQRHSFIIFTGILFHPRGCRIGALVRTTNSCGVLKVPKRIWKQQIACLPGKLYQW